MISSRDSFGPPGSPPRHGSERPQTEIARAIRYLVETFTQASERDGETFSEALSATSLGNSGLSPGQYEDFLKIASLVILGRDPRSEIPADVKNAVIASLLISSEAAAHDNGANPEYAYVPLRVLSDLRDRVTRLAARTASYDLR